MWRVSELFDLVVVGAGPSGSAAAIAAQRAGLDTLLLDAQSPNRDKTCGDGLTPRAMHQLDELGLKVNASYRNRGLKLHGYGGDVEALWPRGEGSASPRATFDAMLVGEAARAGATIRQGCPATGVQLERGAIRAVETPRGEVRARRVIVADGVRSPFGKLLGRAWHKEHVYGIAARSYCASPFSSEPWMHSHVELRDAGGAIQPGYGWIFPLGDGHVNLGCGALSTDARPAKVNTKKLLAQYAAQQREAWQLGEPERVASALLPMGGAVSNVAGPNWALVGDAAACVNPLNGEGIDYGLETAVLAVGLMGQVDDLTLAWPALLRDHYGESFSIARRLAESKQTVPHFYLTVDVRLDALLKLRAELNKSLEADGVKLSVNDLLIKALARALQRHIEMDWMAVSSYGSGTVSSGVVRILKDLDSDLTGRNVLIVEDIIDSGLTLSWLLRNLRNRNPKSLEVVTLLRKPDVQTAKIDLLDIGFDIPNEFVIGYGLDYAERYRDLPYVGTLHPRVYSDAD